MWSCTSSCFLVGADDLQCAQTPNLNLESPLGPCSYYSRSQLHGARTAVFSVDLKNKSQAQHLTQDNPLD